MLLTVETAIFAALDFDDPAFSADEDIWVYMYNGTGQLQKARSTPINGWSQGRQGSERTVYAGDRGIGRLNDSVLKAWPAGFGTEQQRASTRKNANKLVDQ